MRLTIRLGIAVILVVAGWVAGSAQTRSGDFVIEVDASGGKTNLKCVAGCSALVGDRDIGLYRGQGGKLTYSFGCSGETCRATFHGFLKK